MNQKAKRRTTKTKKALQNGLAVMLTDKELRKITVQEVADLANVNRVTFYKHYLDIYDLYDHLEQIVLSDLGLLILGYQEKPKSEFSAGLIDYIENSRNVFRMIFSPYNTGELRDKFCKMVEGLFRLMQAEKNNTAFTDSRMEYYVTYQSHGFISILEKWVQDDFAQSKDFIIKTVAEFDTHTEEFILKQFSAF